MRRAGNHSTATRRAAPPAPQTGTSRVGFGPPREFADCSASTEQSQQLAAAIAQRIESRLPGRVRNLIVRILADSVVLEGQCATYYTKQLAQHAALGILEDEHLQNAIVVTVGR